MYWLSPAPSVAALLLSGPRARLRASLHCLRDLLGPPRALLAVQRVPRLLLGEAGPEGLRDTFAALSDRLGLGLGFRRR